MSIEAWAIVAVGAFFMGLAKGGVPGIGNLSIAIFAMIFPPRESVGLVLPIMISADIVAIFIYKKDADWFYVKKLFPWTAIGILLGFSLLKFLNEGANISFADQTIWIIIGSILLLASLVHVWKKWNAYRKTSAQGNKIKGNRLIISITGISAGFATMTANAAGPIAQLYLLAVGLPKYTFIGTAAWFFFIVNLTKVPLMVCAGSLTFSGFKTSLMLMGFAIIGAMLAPRIVRYIKQSYFEWLIWFFAVVAGMKLIIKAVYN